MKFLIKKICTLIMTLFLVSVAAFLAFQVIPGDVVRSILGTEATPEREAQLREELGLDKPPVERYISWADDVLHGDFGVSYRYSKNMNEMMPVKELIGDKLPVTLYLAVISFVMIVLVSIPLGVLWAKCGNRFLDAVFGVLTQVTMAVPSFFLGILVTYLCGIVLKWFVPGGYVSYQENMTGFLAYLLFPAISIALPKIAMTARFLRNSMLTEMKLDYVRTAYSKGCNRNQVRPCLKKCHDAGHYISRHDDRRNFGRKYRGRTGVCTAWDRQASDQFGRNKRPSGCGDFDFVHYIRGDFSLFYRGYSLPGDRSENPQESIE